MRKAAGKTKKSLVLRGFVCAALLFGAPLLLPGMARALSLGTWNIEYFSLEGKRKYTPGEVAQVAEKIRGSRADIVALQEIRGDAVMRYMVTKNLPGWRFAGNDTGNNQDLYFLWNTKKVERLAGPSVFFEDAVFPWEGRDIALFSRCPVLGFFRERETGKEFALVNLHLKSQSIRGKKDPEEARRYNQEKRQAQIGRLNLLARMIKGPLFLLGDYNVEQPGGLDFYLISLTGGRTTYDNKKSNLDHIGFTGITPDANWRLAEIEGALPGRSTKKTEHPDHDMLVLSLSLK